MKLRFFNSRSFFFFGPEDGSGGADPAPGAGGGNADPESAGDPPQDKGIILSPEQLSGRLNQARSRAQQEALSNVFNTLGVSSEEELQAIADKMREGESEAKRFERTTKTLQAENEQLKQQLSAMQKSERQRVRQDAIHTAIQAEAKAGRRVVNAWQVERLVAPDLSFDEDGRLVVTKNGEVAHGLTVEKHLKGILDDNPNLIEPSGGSGSGSRVGAGSSSRTSDPPDYKSLPRGKGERGKAIAARMKELEKRS